MRLHLPILLLLTTLTTLTTAKHCYNLDENGKTDIAYGPSHDCCMGKAFGVWVSKDCKVCMCDMWRWGDVEKVYM